MKEAYLYETLDAHRVRCLLCNHRCLIPDEAKGICGVRENQHGRLISLVYGKLIAKHVDPIEKKPLFHYLPGSRSYSIATVGCNFRCTFCQNSDISQMPHDHGRIWGEEATPDMIVNDAEAHRSSTIAYTYTEPTVFYELAADTARLAISRGIRNIFVTNGYMTEECLTDLHPLLSGANVDLKAFNDYFYQQQCGAKLSPVLKSIELMLNKGIWVEVTTLLIPGLNDSDEELHNIAQFLAHLDPNIPWHISRFHPTYRLTNVAPTPPHTIQRARRIGLESGLRYVYSGNLPGDEGENTMCHVCGNVLINRFGFTIRVNNMEGNQCSYCNAEIPGVWV